MKKALSLAASAAILGSMLTFPASAAIRGDVNSDGTLNILDVVFTRNYIVSGEGFTDAQIVAADVTGDGNVDVTDVVVMRSDIVSNNVVDTDTPVNTDTDSPVNTDTDKVTDTDTSTSTDTATDTEAPSFSELYLAVDGMLGGNAVKTDSYTTSSDVVIAKDGAEFVSLKDDSSVTFSFNVDYSGDYEIKLYLTSSSKKEIGGSLNDEDKTFTSAVAPSWDAGTLKTHLDAGRTNTLVMNTNVEVYNVCVYAIEVTLISVDEDTDTATEPDTDTATDKPADTDTATDKPTDTDKPADTDTATDKPTDTDTGSEAVDIEPGILTEAGWYIGANGDDGASTVNTAVKNASGGLTLTFDLQKENYPCFQLDPKGGYDVSAYSTVSVIVTNPNSSAVQITPIVKAGTDWDWVELDLYTTIPAGETIQLDFPLSALSAAQKADIKRFIFRVQAGNGAFAGTLQLHSIDFDIPAGKYDSVINEMNRPKSASAFTWEYPENSFSKTVSSKLDGDKLVINYGAITSDAAAGIQTETKPGLGAGLDGTVYSTLTCSITNKGTSDVHITLVLKTGGGWLWQENGGETADDKSTERIIPAGETVDVTYYINGSTWKSEATGWKNIGTLEGANDIRAICFKVYAGQGETATPGTLEISNFSLNF